MPILDVTFGKGAKIYQPDLVNLYGCVIDEETKLGANYPFHGLQTDKGGIF